MERLLRGTRVRVLKGSLEGREGVVRYGLNIANDDGTSERVYRVQIANGPNPLIREQDLETLVWEEQ